MSEREPTRDTAGIYAEARRLWESARKDVLSDEALTTTPSADYGETITLRTYRTDRDSLVGALLEDAAAHEAGRFAEIGERANQIDLPRVGPPALVKLRVALNFWDGWMAARNRGWQPDGKIAQADWPLFARRIASDLSADREISDAQVVAHFDVNRSQ